MLGVLNHLPSIFTSLVNIAECAKEYMVVETVIDHRIDQSIPLLRFYPFDECSGDPTNWFVPNPEAVRAMLRYCGFSVVNERESGVGTSYPRGIYVAHRSTP